MAGDEESGYIIEFLQHGGHVKVTAVDPRSGREVSTIAPKELPKPDMIRLAVKKLEYVLAKRNH